MLTLLWISFGVACFALGSVATFVFIYWADNAGNEYKAVFDRVWKIEKTVNEALKRVDSGTTKES